MSPDLTPASPSEGLRFDEPAPASGTPTCASCQSPIAAAYYEVNGHVVCGGCKSAFEKTRNGSGGSRLLRAAAYGFGGAVLGAGIYYAILAITGYEIGLVAIAVGWLVGRGVQKGSRGMGGWAYQSLAVGLTYLAIVSTYIPFIVKSAMDEPAKASATATAGTAGATATGGDSVAVQPASATTTADSSPTPMTPGRFALGLLALIAIAAAAPFLAGIENILGLVIIGFALYQAWQMNRRARLTINGPFAVGSAARAGE